MSVIDLNHLTKDYGEGKGIFDVSLEIKKGEVYGYLGPNGAGKSTTMRHLMGFIKPQDGSAKIFDLDCWKNQKEIQRKIGYLPGEIALPEDMRGLEYLKLINKMRKTESFEYAKELLEYFEINPDVAIKSMSKGMKQKIAIVAAFMHKPEVLLLDEPSSGLDPLMQSKFIDLVADTKKSGSTILLSSHIFEEVEKTCDKIGMIKNGKLIKEVTIEELKHSKIKTYKMEFENTESLEYIKSVFKQAVCDDNKKQATISISDGKINHLITELSKCRLNFLKEEKHTLEEYFMQFYGGDSDV